MIQIALIDVINVTSDNEEVFYESQQEQGEAQVVGDQEEDPGTREVTISTKGLRGILNVLGTS